MNTYPASNYLQLRIISNYKIYSSIYRGLSSFEDMIHNMWQSPVQKEQKVQNRKENNIYTSKNSFKIRSDKSTHIDIID